jgi:hypothetical protein
MCHGNFGRSQLTTILFMNAIDFFYCYRAVALGSRDIMNGVRVQQELRILNQGQQLIHTSRLFTKENNRQLKTQPPTTLIHKETSKSS